MKLSQVRAYALSLPEVAEEPHFDRTSFRVRGKIFATARMKDEHIHVFVDEADRDQAVTEHPDHMEKLWWGKQVRGLRVNLEKASAASVKKLLWKAWLAKAPASLSRVRPVEDWFSWKTCVQKIILPPTREGHSSTLAEGCG